MQSVRLSSKIINSLELEIKDRNIIKTYLRSGLLFLLKFRFRKFKTGRLFRYGIPLWINKSEVLVGDYSYLGPRANINHRLIVGNMVLISSDFRLIGNDHGFNDIGNPMRIAKTNKKRKTTEINDDVWIGQGVTILEGTIIGKGAIIGASSFVNKNVEPYSIVAGIPAKVIGMRFSEAEIIEHEHAIYHE